MTPGQILLRYYHAPLNRLRDCLREGGPLEQRRTEAGRREMERAAYTLPPLAETAGRPLSLHLLTGRKFWYQTVFCLWTFAHRAGRQVSPVIYDDGALSAEYREPIARLFPTARFEDHQACRERLDRHLPAARFPALRERWLNYPNLRKLTDPHLGAAGWKLVLDSDLLFFRRPDLLLGWLEAPGQPLHAVDCVTSYGYSRRLMDSLAGQPVPDLVNVGLIGLKGSDLDWERMEHWCRTLIARERTSYFLEQALVAMLVAGRDCMVAPAQDYVTGPRRPEATACRAVMHHYVAASKRWYFQRNWRRAVTSGPA